MTFSEGEVVGMDLPNNVDSGTVAGSEETGAQNQELIRKRQKIEHIAFESKDFDTDDAMTAESDAGVQSVEKPEKSHMSNELASTIILTRTSKAGLGRTTSRSSLSPPMVCSLTPCTLLLSTRRRMTPE